MWVAIDGLLGENDAMGMKQQREGDILKACLEYLKLRGVFAWRNNNAGVMRESKGRKFWTFTGLRGVSDILGVLPDGRFLAVEVKRPGEVPTEAQSVFLAQVEQSGGVSCWVDDVAKLIDVVP